jgi:predicted membrane channel-forming protein YqfA (hemolysin III family)
LLVALAVLSFCSGAAAQLWFRGSPMPPSTLAFAVLGTLLVFAWFHIDSTQRNYRRSPWLNTGVVVLSLVALPYYFFRSRGAKLGLLATSLFLLVIIASGVLGVVGQYAAYYSLQS